MKTQSQLLDEIRLREASLADARREHSAGELADADFDVICARETARLERAREELAALEQSAGSTAASHPLIRSRRRRRSRLVVALACFAVAAGVLVWANLGLRQAGTSATGGLSLTQSQKIEQLLTEGQGDVASGDALAALSAYQQVLALQPTNVVALTEAGWLDFSAGSSSRNATVVAHGVSLLHRAVTLAPSQAAPRLYYAIVADATPGNKALATAQFEVFVKLHPSKEQLDIATPFLKALKINA
jgi:hypothetical protein